MLAITFGFSLACGMLFLSFYRKYRDQLRAAAVGPDYSRVADYCGIPVSLEFQYRSEEGAPADSVEVAVDEIYHYGGHYFLGGSRRDGRRQIYRWSGVSRIKVGSRGVEAGSPEELVECQFRPMRDNC